MDPISAVIAGGLQLIPQLLQTQTSRRALRAAEEASARNQAYQQALTSGAMTGAYENLGNQLAFQRMNAAAREQALRQGVTQAYAQRTDQFGNKLYYDPSTNEWRILYTPEQQALITEGQAEQQRGFTQAARTRARAAQAAQDYENLRRGYFAAGAPSEAVARDEIFRLITQARGEGDRALQTLVNRQELRQRGNMPVVYTGGLPETAGERLAKTMLQARTQALEETGKRAQNLAATYLDPMGRFERTANVVPTLPQESNVGAGIASQIPGAQNAIQAALKDYASGFTTSTGETSDAYKNLQNVLASLAVGGGRNVASVQTSGAQQELTAGSALAKALGSLNLAGPYKDISKAFASQQQQQPGGTTGDTSGATYGSAASGATAKGGTAPVPMSMGSTAPVPYADVTGAAWPTSPFASTQPYMDYPLAVSTGAVWSF